MVNYRKNFRKYLDDLARRRPSPGGGSAVCVVFCFGVSLIEKSIGYSLSKSRDNEKLTKVLRRLRLLRKNVYSCIDKDGYIFEKIIQNRGEKRAYFIAKSEEIIVDVANNCKIAFSLAKGIESGIKKSIFSDFEIGLEFIKSCLFGCLNNLEANRVIFKTRNKNITKFKKLVTKIR